MEDGISVQFSDGRYGVPGEMSIGGLKQNDESGARPTYSMPGILHFLQTEWARFEMERAQWDVERAELQARIAFLQGERKGQENLKQDLVRRIKMLEYALKQERAKFHKLKFGKELNQGDVKPPQFDEDEKDDSLNEDALNEQNSNATWRQGRQLLRQYLQEIGYTDTIIDVRSARVRQLLGVQGPDSEDGRVMANGEMPHKRLSDGQGRRTSSKKMTSSMVDNVLNDTEKSVIATFEFLNDQYTAGEEDNSDEEDDVMEHESFTNLQRKRDNTKIANESMAGLDALSDPETEVMAEFEFLAEGAGEARSTDSADWDKNKEEDWDVDQQLINKLKEQYKQERPKGPKRADLKAMLDNLGNENENGLPQSPVSINNNAENEEGRGSFAEDEYEAALGLGELAELTDYTAINNDTDIAYDINSAKEAFRKSWTAKYTLRSHFDGVRALVFHPVEPVLITASEDHTLKLWNLQKTVQAKKTASLDVEPVYTFRAHNGPVLCLAMNSNGESCYSGGADATIRCWNVPNSSIDPYDSFDAGVLQDTLVAHTDAIWGLSIHPTRSQLLSCSADGTVRLWEPGSKSPLLNTFRVDDDKGVPSSVDFVRSELNQMVAGYTSANAYIFDIETSQKVLTLECKSEDSGVNSQINKVISHPTLPTTITAHEDRNIKFFDNNSGKLIHSMTAHLEAVTSLAVDPNGLYLLSASHDSSVRLWNLNSRTCVQELTLHRKKFEEAIHDVAFHPSKPYLASVGADALAKVYV